MYLYFADRSGGGLGLDPEKPRLALKRALNERMPVHSVDWGNLFSEFVSELGAMIHELRF